MLVATGHTLMAPVFFGTTYRQLVADGLYNAVRSAKTGMAVWFALFGLLLFILGMLISTMEKHAIRVSTSTGVALLLLTVLGIVLMPVSGFWLMFPAVFAMLHRHRTGLTKSHYDNMTKSGERT